MAEYKPTESQRRAIEERGNLIVSAAAGAGKTTVLTKRIAGIVKEGTPVDRLLILTFTRAAAQEMRQRIEKELKREVAAAEDAELRRYLMAQVNQLGSAYISTIDSFCGRVLRRYGHRIGLSPDVRTGDETALAALSERAKDDFLHLLGRLDPATGDADPEYRTLLDAFRSEDAAWKGVEELNRFLEVRPDPEAWIEEVKADIESPDYAERMLLTVVQSARFLVEAALNETKAAQEMLMPEWSGARGTLLADEEGYKKLLALADEGDAAGFSGEIKTFKFGTLSFPRKIPDDEKQPVKDARERAKKIFEKARGYFPHTVEEEKELLGSSMPVVTALIGVTLRWRKMLWEEKEKAGLLGFSDAEHIALQLLRDEEVAAEYRERFEYIAVDEYQDSNRLQEALLDCIKREDNLFLVGDVKQSIYRFRAAEPGLFLEKLRGEWNGTEGARLDLNENFRSHTKVLSAVNAVFRSIMSTDVGEMDYDDSAALKAGNPAGEGEGSAELHLIPRKIGAAEEADGGTGEGKTAVKGDGGAEDTLEDEENAAVEARFAARRIHELMAQEGYGFGDFAVLMRTSSHAMKVAETLALCGVPAYVQATGGFFDAIEVVVLLDLLSIVDNRRQDIPLATVLRSPVFGLTDEELARIRLYRNDRPYYEAFLAIAEDAENGEEMDPAFRTAAEKAMAAERTFKRLHYEAQYLGVAELVTKVIDETRYYELVGAKPDGAQRRRNLDALIDQARTFEQSGGSGLWRFLNAMESAKKTASVGAAQEGAGDVVHIMTIHKSKGLEFPVVFVLDTARMFKSDAGKNSVQIHRSLGIGVKYAENRRSYSSLCYRAITEKMRLEELSEEMRVLYVALTRAKKRLIIAGTVNDPEKARADHLAPVSPGKVQRVNNALDWLLYGLSAVPGCMEYFEEDRKELLAMQRSGIRGERTEEEIPFGTLLDRFSWRYPYGDAAALPGKQSVSRAAGLKKVREEPSVRFEAPLFMTEAAKEQASLRGTVVHLILKTLPLTVRDAAEIEQHIGGMTKMGVLEQEETDDIRTEDIVWLAGTPLWARLAAAETVRREWSFTRSIPAKECMETGSEEPVLLQGVIDCCFIEGGAWVLLDYKTDHRRPGTDARDYAEKHRPQIELYADALEKLTGKPVKEKVVVLLSWHEAVRL